MVSSTDLVFVSHTAQAGGAELALLRYLRASSLHPSLITFESGGVWRDLPADGVDVRNISKHRSVFASLFFLRRELTKTSPKIVVANSMRSAFYCALVLPKRVRLVYWVRDGLRNSSMSRLNVWATRFITMSRAHSSVANSEWTAETIRSIRPAMPVRIIPSPSGIDAGKMGSVRQSLLSEQKVSLLYLGRIARWKGVHLAIEALGRLRSENPHLDYRLTVAGGALFSEQVYEQELRDRVTELGISKYVTFTGHINDVQAVLEKHDLLLHCSTVPEPFGQVIVQALGMGLAVIAANAGGPSEIIRHGKDGLLYPPGDVTSLVNEIQNISEHPERIRALSRAALDRAESYSDSEIFGQLDTYFESCCRAVLSGTKAEEK